MYSDTINKYIKNEIENSPKKAVIEIVETKITFHINKTKLDYVIQNAFRVSINLVPPIDHQKHFCQILQLEIRESQGLNFQ